MTLMGQPNKANPGTKMKQGQKPAGLVLPDPISPSHTPTSQAFISGEWGRREVIKSVK